MTGNSITDPSRYGTRVSGLQRLAELAIVFFMLVSGFQHLANPFAFLRSIDNYRLVDLNLGYYVAAVLPKLQVTLAFMLVLGVFRAGSRMGATGLFLVYLVAQLSAKFRGLDIECGCFGLSGSKITWWSIGLVAALTVVAGFLAFRTWQSCRSLAVQRNGCGSAAVASR
jgi:putative oxidoreductase